MASLHLCRHCGDTITDTLEYHDNCQRLHVPRCKKAVQDFRGNDPNVHRVLYMALNVTYLYGTKQESHRTRAEKDEKRYKRDTQCSELLKRASALRNSKGGHLLIQLVGLSPDDSYTGAFDELVDDKLNALIDDGAMFSSVYKKTKMNTLKGLEEYYDFLVIFVDASKVIATAYFATKIALDLSIIDPNPYTIFNFIKGKRLGGGSTSPDVPDDLTNVHESRVLQAKGVAKSDLKKDDIVEEVWTKLKLKDCISAFTKSATGGNYLLGVGEKENNTKYTYVTKRLDIHGLSSEDCQKLEDGLPEKAKESLLLCNFAGKEISQVVLTTKRKEATEDNKYALVINVKPVNGIVFYDKDGPVAYKVERVPPEGDNWEDTVVKVNVTEWFHAILRDSEEGLETDPHHGDK